MGDKRKQKLLQINNLLNELNINVANTEVQQCVTTFEFNRGVIYLFFAKFLCFELIPILQSNRVF